MHAIDLTVNDSSMQMFYKKKIPKMFPVKLQTSLW